ncbi:hypothetical protein BGW36DRAFT_443022 [Talaromyces proteolyticus]|uniref:Uncharacterized protein n=1 Tax=Talaromyces proteolyticus TaxID=1131652 RepID=A0AAD4PZI4_9EURO|nr:uncharacterized protein BGW36DRAFT_443022 [Talaromyces proteolyticus]KAH8703023.1 hypothetical protein BGW36DRAFT_443022 [Talaromyces proteolyticus]
MVLFLSSFALVLQARWGLSLGTPHASINNTSAKLTGKTLQLAWSNGQHNSWKLSQLDLLGITTVQTPNSSYGIFSDYATVAPSTSSVEIGAAGNYTKLQMYNVSAVGQDALQFATENDAGVYTALWSINSTYGFEAITVDISWTPKSTGWYSLLSPTVATVEDTHLKSGVIPGYWTSSIIEANNQLARHWSIGVPQVPMISVEASTTSLVSIIEDSGSNLTYAVVADPSLARDPWQSNAITQTVWQVGMSLRNFDGALSPTAVYPILGQVKSRVTGGTSLTARFWLLLSREDGWFEVNKKVTQDIYPLRDYVNKADNLESLSHRMQRIRNFLVTPASQWHLWQAMGLTVGAESTKISDVGAMWMVDAISEDPIVQNQRLPYARNFKLAQQATTGPFAGAVLGEYAQGQGASGTFVSELIHAGISSVDYVPPMSTNFYALADMGNILLFSPNDTELVSRVQLAADKMLSWQYTNGSFSVGYIKTQPTVELYPQLTDYRATWYGFIPAYKILGQKKYLKAAEQGASWYIHNAVQQGNFLGVCDDSYVIRDFHVIFGAQALLDLHEITSNETYREAAIQVARYYTLHIINHPVVDDRVRSSGGQPLQDWQISQVGMNTEHPGYSGSVNEAGPITLASHAGAFVRFYELTGEQLFLDLARAAAKGRDALVDPTSGIPSYYWSQGHSSASRFPWHGWWHLGWVTDYLLSEAHVRSKGQISFPQGFMTAKVGSHKPYGFEAGTIYGQTARLWMPVNLMNVSGPDVDFITAVSEQKDRLYVILLNEALTEKQVDLSLNPRGVYSGQFATCGKWKGLVGDIKKTRNNAWTATIPGLSHSVLEIDIALHRDPKGPEFRNFTISTSAPGEFMVNWEFWANATSWTQWRINTTSKWNSTPAQFGYNFTRTVNLTDMGVNSSSIDVRIATNIGSSTSTGYSDPVTYTL